MTGSTNPSIVARASVLAVACALVAAPLACAPSGTYVWAHDLPKDYQLGRSPSEYLINDGDTVSITVFNQAALSTHAKVRSDGRVAMPALGDIEMRGKHPTAIKRELEARLKDYVNAPSVTVTVEDFQPIVVSVLGEVAHPGTFPLDPRATVAQVLATAGGLTDYATRDRIFLVRTAPQAIRARFTYADVLQGDPASAGFVLRSGDLLVVE
jgi:polysaccharide biosynthesis/export protein